MDEATSGVQPTSYLLIQNPGEAPPDGFMVFGVSTTAGTGGGTIGQFGSGNKHAINLCLRNKIDPIIFAGMERLSFFIKPDTLDDGLTKKNYGRVFCRVTNSTTQKKKTVDLNASVDYGKFDWNELAMGLREFVSNALDRTIRQDGSFHKALEEKRLTIEIVDASQVRAKSGYTRVYLPLTPDVNQFYLELPKRFLHFSEPDLLKTVILPKRDRNVSEKRVAVIYKKGVFVREITDYDMPSIFDYNFGDELKLDESRVVSDYEVKEAATKALRAADSDTLCKLFQAAIRKDKVWELTFEQFYLSTERIYDAALRTKAKEQWKDGWDKALTAEGYSRENTVLAHEEDGLVEYAESKGHKVLMVESTTLVNAAKENSVATVAKVLDPLEAKGRKSVDLLPAAQEAVDIVWDKLEKIGVTGSKKKPPVKCFAQIMTQQATTHGFYEDGTVFINEQHANAGINKLLLETALEEIGHHVTQAADLSLDFQGYFRKVIVEMWWKEDGKA